MAFWEAAYARPVEERIGAAPPALVEYLVLDTIAQGIPARPRTPTLTPEFEAEVRAAFTELPAPVRRLASARLAGIYFIEDIGGTGFTDQVMDADGKTPAGAFVVLDPKVLQQRSANAWATWKENSPFAPAAGVTLAAHIEDAAGDTRRNAIQFILLHELGHVISVGRNFHPSWTEPPHPVKEGEFPYFDLSWRFDPAAKSYVSRFDAQFPQRSKVVYYFGARLSGAAMAGTYERLERTNFPTLYAGTRPGDDFAEGFATYVHVVLMHRPFEIVVAHGGKPVVRFGSCWTDARCAAKREFFDRLFAAAPPT